MVFFKNNNIQILIWKRKGGRKRLVGRPKGRALSCLNAES